MKNIIILFSLLLFSSCGSKTLTESGGLRFKVSIDQETPSQEDLQKTVDILHDRMLLMSPHSKVYLDESGTSINIELPGEDDIALFGKAITAPGQFLTLEMYQWDQVAPYFERINKLILKDSLFDFKSQLLSPEEFKYRILAGALSSNMKYNLGLFTKEQIPTVDSILQVAKERQLLPEDLDFYWSQDPNMDYIKMEPTKDYILMAIKRPVNYKALTGQMVEDAQAMKGYDGERYVVSITLKEPYHDFWAKMTNNNILRHLAILLDDKVLATPMVQSQILAGQSEISGNYTKEEALQLAANLKNGALPLPIKVEAEVVSSK